MRRARRERENTEISTGNRRRETEPNCEAYKNNASSLNPNAIKHIYTHKYNDCALNIYICCYTYVRVEIIIAAPYLNSLTDESMWVRESDRLFSSLSKTKTICTKTDVYASSIHEEKKTCTNALLILCECVCFFHVSLNAKANQH